MHNAARTHPRNITRCLRNMTQDCHSVVEYGCKFGDKLAVLDDSIQKVGVDIFLPYLQVAKNKNPGAAYIHADVREFIRWYSFVGVDAILMLNFVEHLDMDDALAVIEHAKKSVSRRLVVFVPYGEDQVPQVDRTGLGSDHWQQHRSVWDDDMLRDMGFDAVHLRKCHRRRGVYRGAVFAVWEP